MSKKTLEQVDAAIARWQSRLRRAVRAIEKLEAQKKRIARRLASVPDLAIAPPLATAVQPKPLPPVMGEIDTSIPAFLQRQSGNGLEATRQRSIDADAAEQIKRDQAEAKQRKTRGRIERMKAKQRGDLKRMPLTGKAALEAIRNG
jgi:hypothetical protein